MIELFCAHCKKYFKWYKDLHLKTGDYYRCPNCFEDNCLEVRAINRE